MAEVKFDKELYTTGSDKLTDLSSSAQVERILDVIEKELKQHKQKRGTDEEDEDGIEGAL